MVIIIGGGHNKVTTSSYHIIRNFDLAFVLSLLSSSSSVLPSSLEMVQSSLLPTSWLVVVPAFFLLVLLCYLLSDSLSCWNPIRWYGEMDWWSVPRCFWRSVMILPSLFPFARMHSISASNVYPRLEGPPQIGHPTQTKKHHWFADPELPVACRLPSSTPNRPSPSLVLLLIRLQAARPPILSTRCFGIGACPLNFASNVE